VPGSDGHGAHLLAEVPVVPDADEARRWAEDELARGIYQQRTGLVQRLLEWLFDRLDELSRMASGGTGWIVPTAIVLVLAVGVTVAVAVGAPGRARRAREPDVGVLGAEERTAVELRLSADDAAARGDHPAAVVDRFRAIVRSLADRALLEERPGLTADEAAGEAGARLPVVRADLERAALLFDRVRYGHAGARAEDDQWLRRVDARVSEARAVGQRSVQVEAS
jgi:hypothetical protein